MEENKLAVLMSLYKNDSIEYVRSAVESILNQSYGRFDFYIQCDGPVKPEVEEYLSSLEDDRIIFRKRHENLGLADSLNELLEIVIPAGYEYVARMDADDISSPQRFIKQIDYFNKHPEVSCLGTWAVEITSTGDDYFEKRMPESHLGCLNLFKTRDCLIHPTVMFRRNYFDKAGFYPTDTFFAEDTIMWAKGFASGCVFANVPEFLFRFRIDEHFFDRRRGWKYAKGIYIDRSRVSRMLGFGFKGQIRAVAYACAKLMPAGVLNFLYKTVR